VENSHNLNNHFVSNLLLESFVGEELVNSLKQHGEQLTKVRWLAVLNHYTKVDIQQLQNGLPGTDHPSGERSDLEEFVQFLESCRGLPEIDGHSAFVPHNVVIEHTKLGRMLTFTGVHV